MINIIRGSGEKNVIVSNGPDSTSECFNLLYYLPILYPESFFEKKWPEPTRWVRQTLIFFRANKIPFYMLFQAIFAYTRKHAYGTF